MGNQEIRDQGRGGSGLRESGGLEVGDQEFRGPGNQDSGNQEIRGSGTQRIRSQESGNEAAQVSHSPRPDSSRPDSSRPDSPRPDSPRPDSLIPDSPIPDSPSPVPTPGALTRVPGFRAAGVACGLKESGQLDLALVACERPATAAGMFTTNAFRAAPVLYDAQLLSHSHSAIQGVVINAGNANACTGEQGARDARQMAHLAEAALGLPPGSVLVMSTGVIGHPMPMERVAAGIQMAAGALLPRGGADAARAIMTTDLVPKEAFAHAEIGDRLISIGGIAKGSGMIHPSLALSGPHATMLSLIVTDAAVLPETLNTALERAVAASFNRISVDGDTSTNDTVLLLASGGAGNPPLELAADDYQKFEAALTGVCVSLAKQIARDGEGATRLVEIVVQGAASDAEAERAAKTVATSPLVKTAVFGADPNWGRVLAAIGRSGVQVDPARVSLWLGEVQLVAGGEPLPFDAAAAQAALKAPEVRFTSDLGLGPGQATVWTCDLSYKYVEINAEYHT
jgi:glutamate N-acetyltransferase/amino-acid N-acetyltransferase